MRSKWTVVFSMLAALAIVPACDGGGGAQDEAAQQEQQPQAAQQEQQQQQDGQVPQLSDEQLPEGVTQSMVAEGQQIFTGQGLCQTCHGPDATGTQLAPNLTDDEWLNIDGSYDQIVELVHTGVPQPEEHPAPMPPMGGAQLTDEQVQSVAAYVYAVSRANGGGSGGSGSGS